MPAWTERHAERTFKDRIFDMPPLVQSYQNGDNRPNNLRKTNRFFAFLLWTAGRLSSVICARTVLRKAFDLWLDRSSFGKRMNRRCIVSSWKSLASKFPSRVRGTRSKYFRVQRRTGHEIVFAANVELKDPALYGRGNLHDRNGVCAARNMGNAD